MNQSDKLNPCPMCGSEVEIDHSGVLECYGWDWQTITVECKDTKGKKCEMNLSLSADYFYVDGIKAEDKMIELWNSLYESKTRKN